MFFLAALFLAHLAGTPLTHASQPKAVSIQTYDGVSLNGSLTLPDLDPSQTSIKGAVLIIQGSGNVDLDGDISSPMVGFGVGGQPAPLSKQLSEILASHGIASLRYSKRGVDDSAQIQNQTQTYLEKDALSALTQFRSWIPANTPIGVLGFSEGALIALRISSQTKIPHLFLLSLPSRPIDEILDYQFFSWPTELLQSKFDLNQNASLDPSELALLSEGMLPLMGAKWSVLDGNQDGSLDWASELIPGYQYFYSQIRELLKTPQYEGWYQALKALPSFSETVAASDSEHVFIYQGRKDPQIRSTWAEEDLAQWTLIKPQIRFFENYGHCFAPLEGTHEEVKTSGPLGADLLNALITDMNQIFNSHPQGTLHHE